MSLLTGSSGTTGSESENRKCRVLVISSARPRLAKVMGHLLPLVDHNNNNNNGVSIEFLPCVASFDSYRDESSGENIRYLISVNYHGPDGTQKVGSSLAPFFDEEPQPPSKEEEDDKQTTATNTTKVSRKRIRRQNLGIIGVAIGAGIEDMADMERIRVFFQTLRGAAGGQEQQPFTMKIVQPNPEYATMKEENEAYKALSPEAKEEIAISKTPTIGPGKMAKFANDVALGLIREIIAKEEEEAAKEAAAALEKEQQEKIFREKQQQAELEKAKSIKASITFDPNKPRYACRKCRTILFGEDNMEDPPHVPAQHKFNSRKQQHPGSSSSCQSYFLAEDGLFWMTDKMNDMEGRFNCPKCKTKLGTWHWAGAQCSCGTWVSPAVQIPKSKVDLLLPISATDMATNGGLPPGTIVSPFVLAAQQQQQQQIPS